MSHTSHIVLHTSLNYLQVSLGYLRVVYSMLDSDLFFVVRIAHFSFPAQAATPTTRSWSWGWAPTTRLLTCQHVVALCGSDWSWTRMRLGIEMGLELQLELKMEMGLRLSLRLLLEQLPVYCMRVLRYEIA